MENLCASRRMRAVGVRKGEINLLAMEGNFKSRSLSGIIGANYFSAPGTQTVLGLASVSVARHNSPVLCKYNSLLS
jgi:hypothetical protein